VTVWRGKQDSAAAAAMVFLTADRKTSTRFWLGFWCDKWRILDEDEVMERLRAPAGRSSRCGRMRMERAARTHDGAWPRGPATGLQLAPGFGAWSRGSSEVPRSRVVHHRVLESIRRRARTTTRGRNGRDVLGARARARRQGAGFISFAQIQKCITP
jgi:hypothetical protein